MDIYSDRNISGEHPLLQLTRLNHCSLDPLAQSTSPHFLDLYLAMNVRRCLALRELVCTYLDLSIPSTPSHFDPSQLGRYQEEQNVKAYWCLYPSHIGKSLGTPSVFGHLSKQTRYNSSLNVHTISLGSYQITMSHASACWLGSKLASEDIVNTYDLLY